MAGSAGAAFEQWFKQATGHDPYPFQVRFACDPTLPQLVDVPTGMGKTAMAALGWLWRRRFADDDIRKATPRRLVYCLPMRVLVEQTVENAKKWIDALVRAQFIAPSSAPNVYTLMGGELDNDWDAYPEADAILIGTQDQLLSRALNRGYAMNRYRWPVAFGLLNNDCLWVFDEVQLMGNGLAASAQLDGFRKRLWRPSLNCLSLWMSATLRGDFLRTKDREDWGVGNPGPFSLLPEEREHPEIQVRLAASKALDLRQDQPKPTKPDRSGILDGHADGRISLAVLNTVGAAQKLYGEIEEEAKKRSRKSHANVQPKPILLHSRYRLRDRKLKLAEIDDFAGRQGKETGAVPGHPGLILVSTQVIEAGYDLSAARLWSEIAPWASVVQRLGRLNREGKQPDAKGVFWMPKAEAEGENDPNSPNVRRVGPYQKDDLDKARKLIGQVIQLCKGGIQFTDALLKVMKSPEGEQALLYEPEAVIRPDDLFGLFSTEPDLVGGFTDIAQFVRGGDRNVDVHVYWREFSVREGPSSDEAAPHREELCPVPFYEFRRFLGKKESCWEWDFEGSRWEKRRAADVWPGMTLLVALSQGGYSAEIGWTGNPGDKPELVSRVGEKGSAPADAVQEPMDGMGRDRASQTNVWVSLPDHLADVEAEMREIVSALGLLSTPVGHALLIAARGHDWGKGLDRWQRAVEWYAKQVIERIEKVLGDPALAATRDILRAFQGRIARRNEATSWAKFPDVRELWESKGLPESLRNELKRRLRTRFLPRLRHEAASALVAWAAWQRREAEMTALAAYLIACHHGKVRTALRSLKETDEVFGLNGSDAWRQAPAHSTLPCKLDFAPKLIGASGQWDDTTDTFIPASSSWIGMVAELLGTSGSTRLTGYAVIPDGEPRELGPFALAYLEALVRAADARASIRPGKGSR